LVRRYCFSRLKRALEILSSALSMRAEISDCICALGGFWSFLRADFRAGGVGGCTFSRCTRVLFGRRDETPSPCWLELLFLGQLCWDSIHRGMSGIICPSENCKKGSLDTILRGIVGEHEDELRRTSCSLPSSNITTP